MPDTLGEPLSDPILHDRNSNRPHVLPLHVAQHSQDTERERRRSPAEESIELKEINTENSRDEIGEKDTELLKESDDDSDSVLNEKPEEEPLVAASASSLPQMKRNARKTKDKNSTSPLNLNIETGQNGQVKGHE